MDNSFQTRLDAMHSTTAKILGCAALCGLMGVSIYFGYYPLSTESHARKLNLNLGRGKQAILDFPSKKQETRAILIFVSGEGGWGLLEENIAKALQGDGMEVLGIDYPTYSSSDYDLPTLQADFSTIATRADLSLPIQAPPLVIGGYSTGATLAIAACGGPHPPTGLTGLFLIDPLSRGRFGLRDSDQLSAVPMGQGSYAVADFASTFPAIKVVQWHAADDSLDSREWLDSLTVPHREFDLQGEDHYYGRNRPDFLKRIIPSVDWLLLPNQKAGSGE